MKRRGQTRKSANGSSQTPEASLTTRTALAAVIDYALIVSLVFGGCCTNAWTLEMLLKQSKNVGSALTFAQMAFNAIQGLTSFVTFQTKEGRYSILPGLKPRAIPITTWLVQVLFVVCMSLLNNWAFAFRVPLTVQIIIRSSGLGVSMFYGYFLMNRTYTTYQIMSVAMVTAGVILATLSGPSSSSSSIKAEDLGQYTIGISMLIVASLITGYYGTLQERTYARYGPHWQEGVFYTHLLSMPMFLLLKSDIQRGLSALSQSQVQSFFGIPSIYIMLALNLVTQLWCTLAVNKLSTRVSSVSTNLVLTARKAISLCLSVWWFQNPWDRKLSIGASMVFIGTLLYTKAGPPRPKKKD
ncbi:hypothetical protein M422DRAFT_151233 [Sphaerobolus stellatus SS14]|nr:hypothetical protein M422DRAFT_151233 [Sphaerobolus stellatus SS14]